jgi:hypothetical protein
MDLPNAYTWEAEKGGELITIGGDLSGVERFSLLPQVIGLPQHDLVGVEMIRRFSRAFIRGMGGGPREYLHCVVCKGFRMYVKSTDGTVLITPEDYELYL